MGEWMYNVCLSKKIARNDKTVYFHSACLLENDFLILNTCLKVGSISRMLTENETELPFLYKTHFYRFISPRCQCMH